MAERAHSHQTHAPDSRGTMDLTSHMRTWLGFWTGVKWSSIIIVALLILLAIFRTN
jgi:hypothetical protein